MAITLLVGTIIGAVGAEFLHDWLHPATRQPTVIVAPPSSPPSPAMTDSAATPVPGEAPPPAVAAAPSGETQVEAEAAPDAHQATDNEAIGALVGSLMDEAPQLDQPPPENRPLPSATHSLVTHPAAELPTADPPAWLAYAVPADPGGGRPMIAIVLDDVGLDRANAARAIRLPGPVTLSFMTYAEDLAQQSAEARRQGHELMLHVPMQPLDEGLNAGVHVLRTDMSAEEIRNQIVWGLDRLSGYVGINNHMGSRFTRSVPGMSVVMEELRKRGLLFLDSMTIGDSVGIRVAAQYGVPHVARDVFLDNDAGGAAVDAMLAELERIARQRGYAVGIGHPHAATLDALARWLPGLRERGFELVPISAIVRRVTPPTG